MVKTTRAIKRDMVIIKNRIQSKHFKEECEILQHLNNIGAPVPKLCDFGDDYLVLEDAGPTLNSWLMMKNCLGQKNHIFCIQRWRY